MKLSNTMMINEKLLPTSKKAFTLAEVLITLSILGVVAALTIPTLVNRQSDLAAKTKISKAISAFEDFAAIYMAESGKSALTDLTCGDLSNYFKQVTGSNCNFVTADGVAWHFDNSGTGTATDKLTGYATAVDNEKASAARYGVGMWANNNVVNATGGTDGVANAPAIANAKAKVLYTGASLISGRYIVPATYWLEGTNYCKSEDIAITVSGSEGAKTAAASCTKP